jgi:GAF domain-containing protein
MIERFRAYFKFSQYERVVERNRARYIAAVQIGVVIFALIYSIVLSDWFPRGAAPSLTVFFDRPTLLFFTVGLFVLAGATLLLVRIRQLLAAGVTTMVSVVLITAGVVLIAPQLGFDHLLYAMTLVNTVMLAFLLTNLWGGVIMTALAVMMLIADPGSAPVEQVGGGIFALAGAAVICVLYQRSFEVARVEGGRAASGERTSFAEVIRGLARLASDQQPLEPAMAASLRLIQASYPQFEALGVYLIDETGLYAELIQSVGVPRTSAQGRYTVGDISAVGQAALSEKAQTHAGSAALLPGMRQQIAVPLHLGERIIGVLDLQSRQPSVPYEEELQVFIAVAEALALVVNNTRQFQDAQRRIDENVRLAEQARNALAEVQRLNKRLIGRAWADYLKENSAVSSMEYDSASRTLAHAPVHSPQIDAALRQGQPQIVDGVLAFPLRARGQVIGAIEIDLPLDAAVGSAELALLDELGERFGLAMENVRLLEQTQRSAQRESLVNVISTRIQTTTNVEAMLAETARSLSELLATSHVSIRLGNPDQLQPAQASEEIA